MKSKFLTFKGILITSIVTANKLEFVRETTLCIFIDKNKIAFKNNNKLKACCTKLNKIEIETTTFHTNCCRYEYTITEVTIYFINIKSI